jgi:thioredoxin reductase (NADPH)
MKNLKIAVIGSGPAGLTAGIYLGRALLKPVLFSGFNLGGQLMFTRDIENFPGFPDGMRGPEFMINLQKQAAKFDTELLHQQVTAVDLSKKPFKIWTALPKNMESDSFQKLRGQELFEATQKIKKESEANYSAQVLLIATGANHMMLGVSGEREYLGKGVGFCAVCDGAFYRDKKVFVIGGGDTALGDALALTKFTSEVTIIHRRDQFRASKILQKQVLNNPQINILWNTQVKEITGDGQKVTGLKILEATKERTLVADGVFVAIGYQPNTGLFINQLKMNDQSYLLTCQYGCEESIRLEGKCPDDKKQLAFPTMTSVEGVFAAGDVTDFRYRQAVVAAGSGAMSAMDIERWLESKQHSRND